MLMQKISIIPLLCLVLIKNWRLLDRYLIVFVTIILLFIIIAAVVVVVVIFGINLVLF